MTLQSTTTIDAALSEIAAGIEAVASASLDDLSVDELLECLDGLERVRSGMHDMQLRVIGRLHRSAPPVALGGTPLAVVLSTRWRISMTEARRRIAEAIELGYG